MSERHYQFRRPNPMKPLVHQKYRGGMWWVSAYDTAGNYHTECFLKHEEALAKAYEYAATIKESTK